MPDFIITAERTVTVDQRAVLAMDLTSADDYPGVHAIPEDAWVQTALRQVTGANIRSVIEYDDPQGRLEFVTGAIPVHAVGDPTRSTFDDFLRAEGFTLEAPDFITDSNGVTTDMRGAN